MTVGLASVILAKFLEDKECFMFKPMCVLAVATACLPVPAIAGGEDGESEPEFVYAKDAHRAAKLKLSDENKHARICVRQKQLGSRVRFNRICLPQEEWIAYVESMEEMGREWNNAAKGAPPETEFVGPAGL